VTLRRNRREASQISEDTRIHRIAHTTPQTTPQPVYGLVSQAQELALRLQNLFDFGQRIAEQFHVDSFAVWKDMLQRSRGK
jgi:hypothetical protein